MSSGTPEPGRLDWVPGRWPTDEAARRALERHLAPHDTGAGRVPFAGVEIDLRGAILDGIDLADAWLNLARLEEVSLRGAKLWAARLSGAKLDGADLSGAELGKAAMDHVSAVATILDRAIMTSVDAWQSDFRGARLRGVALNGADLDSCDLRAADFSEAVFESTALSNSHVDSIVLTGATGSVFGPLIVRRNGEDSLLDGTDLAAWMREQGADVEVLQPALRG
jgi:uncharacterized protein YjbI with pentapeptide repeats